MNLDMMIGLTEGIATKADKMRVLERHGVARADIARFLGVRYQQVRNTLEGDKRTGYNPDIVSTAGVADTADTTVASNRLRNLEIDESGSALIPPDLLESLESFDADDPPALYALKVNGGVFVTTGDGLVMRAEFSFR